MDPLVRINQNKYSWYSTLFRVASKQTERINAIDLSDKITKALPYGMRRDGRPLGVTTGKYEPEVIVVKFFMDIWPEVEDTISDGFGSSGNTNFPMLLQFVELGNIPITIMMSECTLVSRKLGHAEGVEASVMEAGFQPQGVSINGKTLYSNLRALGV